MGKDNNSNMFSEELQSKTINFLRFPLIVGVVFIHTDFSNVVMQDVKLDNFSQKITMNMERCLKQVIIDRYNSCKMI